MNRVFGTYEQGRVTVDAPATWPDGSRVEVSLVTPTPKIGDIQHEPAPGVRKEFWLALNDTSSCVLNLDDSFWPLTAEETNLLLDHMDSAEPLDLTLEEIDKMETMWSQSKEQQREMVRRSWENAESLFE